MKVREPRSVPLVKSILKRLLVGRPLATEEAPEQLLSKRLALPVFASDALSSVAYAIDEIMLVLILAGLAALTLTMPIGLAIAALMLIVTSSYRQTVRAYPSGGGAYIVSRENLGEIPGLIAAAALLTDYVLTVAVSIASGVDAVVSAAPSLDHRRILLALIFIAFIMLANLRGVKESGTLFAIPTYAFVVSLAVTIIVGFARCAGGCPTAVVDPRLRAQVATGVTTLSLFLILRAFASGSAALTGVEAISNGVPAFRRPQARNAAQTLSMMAGIAIFMFLGIGTLARAFHVVPMTGEVSEIAAGLHIPVKTVVAQIAETAFGGGSVFFYVVQATTTLILILAANTSFQDFPRLASILARDRYMPRQFTNRGERLVFSNGVLVLALMAAGLILVFRADTTRLIQLYVVGVFASFTLSQSGMVRHWMKDRGPNWHRSAVINGIGAATTGVVLVVVTVTKFKHGAWIVVVAIPIIVLAFKRVHRHYLGVGEQLRAPQLILPSTRGINAVVAVRRVDEATLAAISYAKTLRPLSLRAVHVGEPGETGELLRAWDEQHLGFALDVVARGDLVPSVRSYIRQVARPPGEFLTVIIPESLRDRSPLRLFYRRRALRLKAAMLFEPHVVVTDAPRLASAPEGPRPTLPAQPSRNEVVVLVSAVHNASLAALAYGRSLLPAGIRAATFNLDERETERMMEDWSRAVTDIPLEILDSPYRDIRRPVLKLVRSLKAQTPGAVVTVILPEFVLNRWWHHLLHNATALSIKWALYFEPDVLVSSVPYHLR